jgi:ubiquinone/menaquinone biosynthesis C-methylase UbiE
VLEIAPGPGYFAIELAKLGDYRITGLDISKTFVKIAKRNAAQANVRMDFHQGNASGMSFKSDSFDFLLCRAAFKNFGAPLGALREMHRRAYTKSVFEQMVSETRFDKVQIREAHIGLEILLTKVTDLRSFAFICG